MLSGIERLASAGLALLWLHPKSKRPIGEDWSERPVAPFEKLERSYRKGNNVGVRLGKWSKVDGHYLHVIDMDVRDPACADEARAKLQEIFPEFAFDRAPTVISGSGGESRHFYLLCPKAFPSKKLAHSDVKVTGADGRQHWAWEIELFGTGKQVAIPPSIHPDTGLEYRWERRFRFDDLDVGIGPFVPAAALTRACKTREPAASGDRTAPMDMDEEEAEAIVAKLPLADYCHGRDGWLTVGMALHHQFGPTPEAYRIWRRFSEQSEKYEAEDQRRVWKSFGKSPNPVSMATLVQAVREAQWQAMEFEDFTAEDEPKPKPYKNGKDHAVSPAVAKLNRADVEHKLGHVPKWVARINREHAVAMVAGKTVILTNKEPDNPAAGVDYGSVGDLHNFYDNDRIAKEGGAEVVTKLWMRHKARLTYKGIVFAPGGAPPNVYNHWRGFAVKPDERASCRLFLKHLWEIICKRDQVAYDYAIGWFAHMIQKPEEKPGVAFVVKGQKGTGKDTLADYVGKLFPAHHVKISNQEQLTGKFNAHQEKCLLLHVEEGYWAGNRAAEGPLKHLITSESVLIEPKGVNAFSVASVLRLFMTSNEDWVVPASNDERRYFVLNVSSAKIKNEAYFTALRAEMNGEGPAGLLHFLQTYDISDFSVRAVPDTEALGEQKTMGLKNIEKFWYDALHSGHIGIDSSKFIGSSEPDESDEFDEWPSRYITVRRDEFREAYAKWMKSRRYDGDTLNDKELGKHLKRMLGNKLKDKRLGTGKARGRSYVFPDLEVCRQSFEIWLGSEVIWTDF